MYYMIERYYFSLVSTFEKAMNNLKLKVDLQKGALRFRGSFPIDVLVSSNLP